MYKFGGFSLVIVILGLCIIHYTGILVGVLSILHDCIAGILLDTKLKLLCGEL